MPNALKFMTRVTGPFARLGRGPLALEGAPPSFAIVCWTSSRSSPSRKRSGWTPAPCATIACATFVFIGRRRLTARRERANGDHFVWSISARRRAAKPFAALLAGAIGRRRCDRRRHCVRRLLRLLRLLRLHLLLMAEHDHAHGADLHIQQYRDLGLSVSGAQQRQHGFLVFDALDYDERQQLVHAL